MRDTYVFSPILSRDENGKLVIATNEDGSLKVKEDTGNYMSWYEFDDDEAEKWPTVINGGYGCFSPLSKEDTLQLPYTPYPVPLKWWINSNLADPDPMDDPDFECTDVYIIRVVYRDKEEHNSYLVDWWILPEGVSTVLNLEEEQPDPTPSEENYTVDLGDSQTISADAFAEILAENATKDIIIKSNNDVTFTFAKGTMASVDGKTEYDFSTSINNTYADTMPYYITKDNFVSQITFNYSGKLPATAYIRFYAGTQYAGKTLYYSLMNEDKTFAEVQAVVVDADGYMTVKQDHCSSYVVTTTEPKSAGNTADSKDKPTGSPKTGDTTPIALYLALAAAFMGTIVLMKKQKNAGKLY